MKSHMTVERLEDGFNVSISAPAAAMIRDLCYEAGATAAAMEKNNAAPDPACCNPGPIGYVVEIKE